MLHIIFVFSDIRLSLIGANRLDELPLGLHTMCETAIRLTNNSPMKPPQTLVFGSEQDQILRAGNGIMQCATSGNQLVRDMGLENLTNAWASFLQWHDWWSEPHWTNHEKGNGNYYAQCTDCGKTTKGAEWPEKCHNKNCASHVNWHIVNGVAGS